MGQGRKTGDLLRAYCMYVSAPFCNFRFGSLIVLCTDMKQAYNAAQRASACMKGWDAKLIEDPGRGSIAMRGIVDPDKIVALPAVKQVYYHMRASPELLLSTVCGVAPYHSDRVSSISLGLSVDAPGQRSVMEFALVCARDATPRRCAPVVQEVALAERPYWLARLRPAERETAD